MARLLNKQKVLELLTAIRSKGMAIDELVTFVKTGTTTSEKGSNKDAISFILSFIAKEFPNVGIPLELRSYVQSVSKHEETPQTRREQGERLARTQNQIGKKELGSRARRGEITSQANYTLPILESLIEMGGSGKMSDVLEKVLQKMKDRLTAKDHETLPSGIAVRWKNKAQWERQRLKTLGYLKKDSPSGFWEITEEGRKHYEQLKGKQ